MLNGDGMKQYCRYCSHCFYGDAVWCETKEQTMSESTAKRPNQCLSFDFCEIDAFCENPNPYRPREKKCAVKKNDGNQLSMFEEGNTE